uniref:Sec63-domain-containing protein n=1 Tax=Tetraselmis sp. GSL018 TaxID=582737 RepID=A0A061RFI5_9CHLO
MDRLGRGQRERAHLPHRDVDPHEEDGLRARPAHRLLHDPHLRASALPSQYYVRVLSESWLHAEAFHAMSLQGLVLPDRHRAHTELLDLDPLPRSALNDPVAEAMYEKRFTHFNPIQTQAFHTLYHTDESVLLGAPTGSGKTVSSELTILRLFKQHPGQKVVYIAPLKALVRERIDDWTEGLCRILNKRMVELTGEYTPDIRALLAADLIICTPEKWDGISRNWQSRGYVKKVGLLIIDEIHLLGADRGPILEVIVSRMRYIASQTGRSLRLVGLSTALSNAQDLADWMGIGEKGFFNFKPSVRPVPLEAHIQGYPGKFYCPRMATMNKPAYAAIQTHSPTKPVLVFVSSRRQTRLTALDIIAYAAADERPEAFVRMADGEMEAVLAGVRDPSLRHTLQFGIGMHHAGLCESDRKLAETLFVARKIQVLVATSTLAWGVNTPAHLVIIKGTEFFDAPTKRYVDFPITDILQMMGRAGRPQYDKHGVAVIMVHEPKKNFYKKFLYEPFPVESSLPEQLAEHINAEVVSGTIATMQDAVDYLSWTFFYRRLLQNPSYYDLESTEPECLSEFLSGMVEDVFATLEEAGCVETDEDGGVEPTTAGRVASYYYLHHRTMLTFSSSLHEDMTVEELLHVLCAAHEFSELPVRHNEDKLNFQLAGTVRWQVDTRTCDDPHTKANLLLQAHFGRGELPISDYVTDTKTVLDSSLRFMQAMADVSADSGWLATTIAVCNLVQCCMQGLYPEDPSVMQLPHITAENAQALPILPKLLADASCNHERVTNTLTNVVGRRNAVEVVRVLQRMPIVSVSWGEPRLVELPSDSESDNEEGDEEHMWEVTVRLVRDNGPKQRKSRASAPQSYAPRFPKVKEEGWWLLLGHLPTQELYAIKRLSFSNSTSVRLNFPTTAGNLENLSEVTVILLSDAYIGLDQQYTIKVPVHDNSADVGVGLNKQVHPARARRRDEASGDAQEK